MRKKIVSLALSVSLLMTAATAYALHQNYRGFPIVNVIVNENPIKMDVPAIVMDGRTLLPLRAVAEALGATVHWDQELSTVYVTDSRGGTPLIAPQATAALTALRDRDWETLASLVHPDLGVRFSPYGNIKPVAGGDRVRTAAQVRLGFTDTAVYRWGHYDGTGDPIDLSFQGYFNRFVYNADFVNAPVVKYNRIAGRGNTLINLHEVYPHGQFVEYHFPGFDPQFGGMDWQSLRLVFAEKSGNWYLVGIVHDQWTI